MSDPVRKLRWDSESAAYVEADAIPRINSAKANWWDKAYYGPSLEIASHAGNALLGSGCDNTSPEQRRAVCFWQCNHEGTRVPS